MSLQTMREALLASGMQDCVVEVFDSLPSTSQYLSGLVQHSPQSVNGSCSDATGLRLCVTDWQTNGVGRRGKSWDTEKGNVTFSLLTSITGKPAELMGISLVTGICVAESLSTLAGIKAKLKWPNDVFVDNKKLCGLLTELMPPMESLGSDGRYTTQVVVGIGINYTVQRESALQGYESVSVPALCENVPPRAMLIADICARLVTSFSTFASNGWPAFAERWNSLDYLAGRAVRVISGKQEEHAVAVGVSHDGALLIDRDGEHVAVYSGDVSVRTA